MKHRPQTLGKDEFSNVQKIKEIAYHNINDSGFKAVKILGSMSPSPYSKYIEKTWIYRGPSRIDGNPIYAKKK